jgi:hypothetical protein
MRDWSLPTAADAEAVWDGARKASEFFMGSDDVHKTLSAVTKELEDAGIPYAVMGAMALNQYGHRRVTVDVDILLSADGLARFKSLALGKGYVEKFPGSRGVRDTRYNVTIDFLIAGDYPGDGKPKAVQFPDPATEAKPEKGVRLLPVARFVELKLASAMSAPHRIKDFADVQELIKSASLPKDLADRLDASVRDKYLELWGYAQIYDPISER